MSKKEDESQNSVNDEINDKPTFTQSIGNDNENFNDDKENQSEDSEETPANVEIIDNPTPNEKIRNFKYLDDLIHSDVKEIVLDSDIVLSDKEESEYVAGIKLNVDDLVIDGNNHTIDARGLVRIFYCTGENIVLKNVTLKNGYAEGNGASIYNTGKLTIICSKLNENVAQGYGGAIHNECGEISITESIFNQNSSQRKFCGGGAISNTGKIAILESTLNENTAQTGGGALCNNCGEMHVMESTLNENAAYRGGAIYKDGGELIITKSAINENTAKYGGAICGWSNTQL